MPYKAKKDGQDQGNMKTVPWSSLTHSKAIWMPGESELSCAVEEQAWNETLSTERFFYSGIIFEKAKGNISCANEFLDYMFYPH